MRLTVYTKNSCYEFERVGRDTFVPANEAATQSLPLGAKLWLGACDRDTKLASWETPCQFTRLPQVGEHLVVHSTERKCLMATSAVQKLVIRQ